MMTYLCALYRALVIKPVMLFNSQCGLLKLGGRLARAQERRFAKVLIDIVFISDRSFRTGSDKDTK
jgi:hypothetical protein